MGAPCAIGQLSYNRVGARYGPQKERAMKNFRLWFASMLLALTLGALFTSTANASDIGGGQCSSGTGAGSSTGAATASGSG